MVHMVASLSDFGWVEALSRGLNERIGDERGFLVASIDKEQDEHPDV
jgi:hypothetical protein